MHLADALIQSDLYSRLYRTDLFRLYIYCQYVYAVNMHVR